MTIFRERSFTNRNSPCSHEMYFLDSASASSFSCGPKKVSRSALFSYLEHRRLRANARTFSLIVLAVGVAGCQSGNDSSAAETSGVIPQAPLVAAAAQREEAPAPSANVSPSAVRTPPIVPSAGKAPRPQARALAHGAPPAEPNAMETGAPMRAAPAERAIRYVRAFNVSELAVYARPDGKQPTRISEKSLPRVPMGAADARAGVAVYEAKDSYVRIAMPDGGSGWVTIDSVQLTAAPCRLLDLPGRASRGPIGAGSADVACAE